VTSRSFGSSRHYLSQYAWHLGNAEDRSHPVGLLKPNDFGLFDMYGNAWEWCQTTSKFSSLQRWRVREDEEDATRLKENQPRMLRGGAFDTPRASTLRSAARWWAVPVDQANMAGLRVARTLHLGP